MNPNRLPLLDFAHSRADAKKRRFLVLAIFGVLLGIELGLIGWKFQEIEGERTRLASEQTRLTTHLKQTPATVISKELGVRLAAAKGMVNSLSVPWEGLLAALEKAHEENIIVETVRPEVSGNRVEIGVLTSSFSEVKAFIARLAENKPLQQVVLLSETPAADKSGSIRFVLTAVWREEP